MKKTLYKDINLKSGIVLPKDAIVELEPHEDHVRLGIVHYNDNSHIIRYTSVVKPPATKTLEKWEYEGFSKTVAGKKTEPDGYDEDGFPSWLLALGYI